MKVMLSAVYEVAKAVAVFAGACGAVYYGFKGEYAHATYLLGTAIFLRV